MRSKSLGWNKEFLFRRFKCMEKIVQNIPETFEVQPLHHQRFPHGNSGSVVQKVRHAKTAGCQENAERRSQDGSPWFSSKWTTEGPLNVPLWILKVHYGEALKVHRSIVGPLLLLKVLLFHQDKVYNEVEGVKGRLKTQWHSDIHDCYKLAGKRQSDQTWGIFVAIFSGNIVESCFTRIWSHWNEGNNSRPTSPKHRLYYVVLPCR